MNHRIFSLGVALGAAAGLAAPGSAQPILPDFGAAEFGPDSSISDHPYFPLEPGTRFIYEGESDEGFEHVDTFVTFGTKNILGVETRIVRDTHYVDDVLVEVASDWYAQSKDGTVWYMGEHVNNYEYDDQGNLIDITTEGSWIADGVKNFPGAEMLANPQVGDEYYQEYAPKVSLDFARIIALDGTVDIPFGQFQDVLVTHEGNLFDGPGFPDGKLFAPGVGLVVEQVLDDAGNPEFEIPLISKTLVPAPGLSVAPTAGLGTMLIRRRRRGV